jgi:hypothetical protein
MGTNKTLFLSFCEKRPMKTGRKLTAERGMQDVFLFHKNACASRQGLFICDEKFD